MKQHVSSLFRSEFAHIVRIYWKQLVGISFLIGFLLFLFNIFLSISTSTYLFSDTLKDKLGMYFYIKDVPGQESIVYEKLISLKDSLTKQGLDVSFSSKEDALKFLEKKIPDVVQSFDKFGIKNPIPSTLYVMFSSKDQYETLKTTILGYKDIILNIKDVSQENTIKQQETRTLRIITVSNFVAQISIVIMFIILLTILAFLAFFIKLVFEHFKEHFHLQKMLGAFTHTITYEFTRINIFSVLAGFGICFGLLAVSLGGISVWAYELFDVGLFSFLSTTPLLILLAIGLGEILIILLFTGLFSAWYVNRLEKSV